MNIAWIVTKSQKDSNLVERQEGNDKWNTFSWQLKYIKEYDITILRGKLPVFALAIHWKENDLRYLTEIKRSHFALLSLA